jgi:hypothetical protein
MQEESVIPTANKVIIIYAPKIIAHNQIEVQQIAPIFFVNDCYSKNDNIFNFILQ